LANRNFTAALLLLTTLACTTPLRAAELDSASVRDDLNTFKQSEQSRYAPKTIERAEAYLGAAMLAHQQQKADDEKAALKQAQASLTEASETAAAFGKQFASLLRLSEQAKTVSKITSALGANGEHQSVTELLTDAAQAFDQAITMFEQGDLNRNQKYIDLATKQYTQVLEKSLPELADMADFAISKAANAGAKQFAPVTYETAKQQVADLRGYVDGTEKVLPVHPEEPLYLARQAKQMSQQVKALRKKTASHEKLLLEQKAFNLKLASILGMEINSSNPLLADISTKQLLLAVKQARQTLSNERQARQAERIQLQQQFKEKLETSLAEQTKTLTKAQQDQMSNIKDAFSAKLERETYEQKRQQRLRAVFHKGEAEILANLDGSLLIRLGSLKYASGSSKINAKYYDMLGRLKEALAIYGERNTRIEGHTDNQGDVRANQRLSLKRAESVRDFLIAAGADGTRLKALGYGEVRPIASNEFERGRDMNRRIDIVIEAAPASK